MGPRRLQPENPKPAQSAATEGAAATFLTMPKKESNQSQVVLYHNADGKVTVNVLFAHDNFWLTQRTMADLFGVKIPAVNKHLKNIYASGELTPGATISKMEMAQMEGARQISREIEFYNLDAVIAVGYRVNSVKATHFRIWATNTLRELFVCFAV